MGKVRKPKHNKTKKTIVSDNIDDEEQIPLDSKENVIQTIVDQLQVNKSVVFKKI